MSQRTIDGKENIKVVPGQHGLNLLLLCAGLASIVPPARAGDCVPPPGGLARGTGWVVEWRWQRQLAHWDVQRHTGGPNGHRRRHSRTGL